MDSPIIPKAIGPKQVKQTFNVLLHQALDEEQERPQNSHPIEASPISCPSKTLTRAEAWESAFPVALQSVRHPEPTPGQPLRVKYTRKKGTEARARTVMPVYDSMELQKQILGPKLRSWISLSESEADDADDELTHRRKKGSRKGNKKEKRLRMLGAVNLGMKPKQS